MCENKRRQLPLRDQRACDHRLSGSGWRDENAVSVREYREHCRRLERGQLAAKLEREQGVVWPAVVGHELATGARDRILNLAKQATREVEVGQVLFVAADQPGRLVGGEPKPLALVEERIVQRGQVFQLCEQ